MQEISWLLEPSYPAVRYATLTQLLGRSERSAAVREARAAIMHTGVVPEILAQQNADIESMGKPSKWVTLHALRCLQAVGRLEHGLHRADLAL